MAREAKRLEEEFIATAKEKTGHTVAEWMDIIAPSGLEKTNEMIKWLKTEHSLNHLQANFLTGIYKNDGKPVINYDVMFANLFDGRDSQLPAYRKLESLVQKTFKGKDVVLVPTKTYVSIEGTKVFGCAKLNKSNIRIGMDLGDEPFGDLVQPAKGLGAMPNISHMIEVQSEDEVNDTVMTYLKQAFEHTHS